VEQARVTAKSLIANADAFFSLGPITHLELQEAANYMARIAALPQLARVRMLNLQSNRLMGTDVRTLVESPCVARLGWLSLDMNDVGDEGAEAIGGSRHLRNLSTLRLDHTGVGDRGLLALAESPQLGKLKAVYLCGNQVDRRQRGARALVARLGLGVLT
jgi:hypothetical protein